MTTMFTMLPKNTTSIEGTPMLGFCMASGAWADGQPALFRGTREVPLGTAFIAVVPEVQYGFKRWRGPYVVAPTRACALASPLCHDPAWRRTAFLPLADPATGTRVFTFFARTSGRIELIEQLIAATRQRAALGVRALPVVQLARESYRASDIMPFITPELSAQAAALCPSDAPDPPFDDMDLFGPALPIVAWIDLTPSRASRSHTDQLTPATRQILARLPDPRGAVRLAHAYLFAPASPPGPIQTALSSAHQGPARQDDTPIRLNFIAEQLKRMIRRDVPALNALSDEELNVACNVAFAIKHMDDDEYFYFAEMFRMPPGAKDAGDEGKWSEP